MVLLMTIEPILHVCKMTKTLQMIKVMKPLLWTKHMLLAVLAVWQFVAGKAPITLVDGNLYDDTAEFVSVSYGKDVKLTAYAGQPTDYGFE